MKTIDPNTFLIIISFFYKHTCLQEYTASLIGTAMVLERMKIKWDYWSVRGNFHMDFVTNAHMQKFLDTPGTTDLMIIDTDESWNPQHLVRLLLHEEEAVCGVYLKTCRDDPRFPVALETAPDDGTPIGRLLPDGNCLLKANRVPGGFLRLKRSALEKYAKAYPDEWVFDEGRKIPLFFKNEVRDHVFHGMDFVFTSKMREAGIDLWVDPICDVSHWGMTEFRGTLDEHLRGLKTMQDNKEAFRVVADMARKVQAVKHGG